MDLREHLFALVGARPGDALALDPPPRSAVLRGASTEVAMRLTWQAEGRAIHVEVMLADPPRPHAARTAELLFSYRQADGGPSIPSSLGVALCEAIAARARAHEDGVLAAIRAQSAVDAPRIREVTVDHLLEPVADRAFTLSPYVGCLVGCKFCYAQRPLAELRRFGALPMVPWGSYVDVRVNAAEVLARELAALPPLPIKLCPIVSDPYQAVEARYGITRSCLAALRDAEVPRPVLVLTRLPLITRDIDVLASIPGAYAGFSIPTIDDDAARHFEPRAAEPSARIEALRAIRAAGVRTFAVVQPMLPGPVEAFADALAEVVTSASIGLLEGVEGAEREFSEPRYAFAREPGWQRAQAEALRSALRARGVAIWPGSPGELPEELCGGESL